MSTPARFTVLRRHEKPLSNYKVTYEVYDPDEHVVYLCYLSPRHPWDAIPLDPSETVADYLRTTSETWVYEEPTEEEVEAFVERFVTPMRHVCEDDFECEDDDCLLCDDETERFLADG